MTQRNAIAFRPSRRMGKISSIGVLPGNLWQRYRNYLDRRHAVRALERLSNAQLEDIGIPRYKIREIVNEKFKQTVAVSMMKEQNITPKEQNITPMIQAETNEPKRPTRLAA